jgi:hypothetical protein
MSDQEQKDKRSKRLQKEENAIKKQMNIAKSYGVPVNEYEGHRYAKKHVLNCGDPDCVMCANPRKTFKEKTKQEASFDQTKTWDQE